MGGGENLSVGHFPGGGAAAASGPGAALPESLSGPIFQREESKDKYIQYMSEGY